MIIRIKIVSGPPNPMIMFETTRKIKQRLGDVNKNEIQYEYPADAGPNKKSAAITPDKLFLSVVVKASTLKMNIKAIIVHSGNW